MTATALHDGARTMLDEMLAALRLPGALIERLAVAGRGRLESCFPVSELAVASIAAAGAAIARLVATGDTAPSVSVDERLASLWFGWSIVPVGWELPSPWDPLAGDYRTTDGGWIKLHTNASHHRAAALSVLACEPTRNGVADAVAGWNADTLEAAVVAAGGCAATMRSIDHWTRHPQGHAVASEPLVIWDHAATSRLGNWAPTPTRPLGGLRVLDLTRVIAGPVATRTLAGFGADVLRIDPLDWDEPALEAEVLIGKRCARLDLREPAGRAHFEHLLAESDVIVHGYRADTLERLGYGADARQQLRPGLIDVSLDAYGHSGPWARRRGFDSLVQFSSGIAAEGMAWRESERPHSLPVQALDHATGYLLAAAAVSAVVSALEHGRTHRARLSLARTAKLLVDHQGTPNGTALDPIAEGDLAPGTEQTPWGPARRLRPPVEIAGTPMWWSRPAGTLGASPPAWTLD